MKDKEFEPVDLEEAEKEIFGEEEEDKEKKKKKEESGNAPVPAGATAKEEPEPKGPEPKGEQKPEPAQEPKEEPEPKTEDKPEPEPQEEPGQKKETKTAPEPAPEPKKEPEEKPEPKEEPKKEPEGPEELKEETKGETPAKTEQAGTGQHLFAIRTTVGKEATVADFLSNRSKMEKLELASFVVPSSLKGYILVESPARDELVRAVSGIQHIRGIIQGEVDFSEITHYLEAKVVKDIPEKALVELVSGPFKGEKAKVVRVDKSKDAITVELIEATVPIPITVKMDAVRVLAKDTSVLQEADITTKEEE